MTQESNPQESTSNEGIQKMVTPLVDPYKVEPLVGDGLLVSLESLLKRPGRLLHTLREGRAGLVVAPLLLVSFVCLLVYGLVAGSQSGGNQLWLAPLKIIVGAFVGSLICLPSLYVFLCLGGVDARLKEVMGSLVAMVTLTSVMLIGLAPVAWVFSQSTDSVAFIAVLHIVFWAIAVSMGSKLLNRFLGSSNARARLRGWLAIYLLVCVQMMTALRPIIGTADSIMPTEKRFFVQHFFEMFESDARDGNGDVASENDVRRSR